MRDNAKKVARFGLLAALSLVLGWVDRAIPLTALLDGAVPGIKLGLCNIVIVFALYELGFWRALLISLVRVVVIGLLFSGSISIFYALGGALLSLIGMELLRRSGRFSVPAVSAAGGALHSIGQILVAAVLTGGTGIFRYLPVLLLTGEFCGLVIGLVDRIILHRLKRYKNQWII